VDQITDSKTATQSVLFSGKRKKKKGKTKNNFRGRKKGGKSVGEQNNELVVVNLPEKIQQNVKIMKKKKKKKKKEIWTIQRHGKIRKFFTKT